VWKAISQISIAWLKHRLCMVPCISSSKSQLGDVNPTFLAHSVILGFLWVICNLITLGFPCMGFLQATQYTLDFTLLFWLFSLLGILQTPPLLLVLNDFSSFSTISSYLLWKSEPNFVSTSLKLILSASSSGLGRTFSVIEKRR
jgi:hypothetical protein